MRRGKRKPGGLGANLTPMIDVVFLLIIFFVLVSHIARAERVELALPQLVNPAAGAAGDERDVVVSILPSNHPDAARDWCQVGVRRIENRGDLAGRLADALAEVLATDPTVRVVIRAPRDAPYDRVHPALDACRQAGVPEAQLATEVVDG